MGMYRKKPVVIEARMFTTGHVPDEACALARWCGGTIRGYSDSCTIAIDTLEGTMHAQPGDWIIKGVKNEFYPCKADIFAATYEPADVG